MALFSFRLEDCSTDDSLSVMFKDSTSWCHIAYAIPSVVEIRGYLCNMDAAWDAKSRHCDIGVIFSVRIPCPYQISASLQSCIISTHGGSHCCLSCGSYCRLLKRPILAVLSILYHSSSY
ncbi:hypothetical protein Bca52824_032120 [Brassica carinata]|uniref:Uncharacterized protein n=1 Tax=Brassica carinata TaxID=52824 RepID=A0A8X7SAG2_BRACI|nr:hypothetical protein Bca52824_032120 [Brassica carinata]